MQVHSTYIHDNVAERTLFFNEKRNTLQNERWIYKLPHWEPSLYIKQVLWSYSKTYFSFLLNLISRIKHWQCRIVLRRFKFLISVCLYVKKVNIMAMGLQQILKYVIKKFFAHNPSNSSATFMHGILRSGVTNCTYTPQVSNLWVNKETAKIG